MRDTANPELQRLSPQTGAEGVGEDPRGGSRGAGALDSVDHIPRSDRLPRALSSRTEAASGDACGGMLEVGNHGKTVTVRLVRPPASLRGKGVRISHHGPS